LGPPLPLPTAGGLGDSMLIAIISDGFSLSSVILIIIGAEQAQECRIFILAGIILNVLYAIELEYISIRHFTITIQ
jgi:hypothetical protein